MGPVAEQAGPGFAASPAAGAVGGAETLTFLFTDIEGSTALLGRVGEDVYAQVLASHQAIIRSGLAGHGGREVDTQGDGFFAVFPSPRACVAAALEIQRALRRTTSHSCLPGRTSRGVGLRFDQLCARGTSDLNRSQKGIVVQAITVRDRAAGAAGLTLSDIPYPHASENDVIVRVHAAGFTPGELDWPGTWTDRAGRDRTPSVPGHELSGVVTELGYGTHRLDRGPAGVRTGRLDP